MGAPLIKLPTNLPSDEVLSTYMVLDDEYVFINISSSETIEINLRNKNLKARPVPGPNSIAPITIRYTAQMVCDHDEFRVFYKQRIGKVVKMLFENFTYYGYITDVVFGDEDIEFSFTHTQKIATPETDRFLFK